MANKQAYPNTLLIYTVQIYVGGMPVTGVLSNATVTLAGGSPLTATVSGMDILVTIPNDQPIADDVSVVVQWTQVVDGITSVQDASYFINIVAAPTGSSQSFVPTNYVRQCKRLTEPADTTVEQYNGGNLAVYADIPYSTLRCIAANLPSSGPDVVNFSYTDTQGQSGSLAFNCWCWMSDNAYIFVSADNGVQFAVASVNGNFYNAYAQAINTRNTNGGTSALMPCANASRYNWPALLVNQVLPTVFFYDGVLLAGGSSSSSG